MEVISFKLDEFPKEYKAEVDDLLREAYGSNDDVESEQDAGADLSEDTDIGDEDDDDLEVLDIITIFLAVDSNQQIVGHLATYLREIEVGAHPLTIGMIGSVATKIAFRQQGIAKLLVEHAHRDFLFQNIIYSILFAYVPNYYISSGYRLLEDKIHYLDYEMGWRYLVFPGSMVCELSGKEWPAGIIDLKGADV